MRLNIALLGFGNVGRALAELIMSRSEILHQQFGIELCVVGISTGRHGHIVNPDGLDLQRALAAVQNGHHLNVLDGNLMLDTEQFIDGCKSDLFFESIPTNPQDGQPALGYARELLGRSCHLVTANKGPVAFGYHELSALAAENNVGFFFESTVMDGAPVHGVLREGLPGATVNRVSGIFNSTTNYILTRMEQDHLSFEDALSAAQAIGIAETDPSLDIDGWDAAIKTTILANVAMQADLRPAEVYRTGIRGIALQDVQQAASRGKRIRLVCEAVCSGDHAVTARVAPVEVDYSDTMAGITGTTSIVSFDTDILPRLTMIEYDPGPFTTAYGMLADMINIVRGRSDTRPVLR